MLQGFYAVHDELGSGGSVLIDFKKIMIVLFTGFGKVRLATHLLTNQKVAIKIIDKKQLGVSLLIKLFDKTVFFSA